jgi:hypothetical protein
MSTTNSRILANSNPQPGVYFVADNSGRNIQRTYATYSISTGTQSVAPNADLCVYNFVNPLTGPLTINVTATYSYQSGATGSTTNIGWTPRICDEIVLMFNGGATTYSITYGSNIKGAATTLSIGTNLPAIVKGVFNGTEYIVDSVVATS